MMNTRTWLDLDQQLISQLENNCETLEFEPGDIILKSGDKPKGLYLITSGLVSLNIPATDLNFQHSIRFFNVGDFFGHRSIFSEEETYGTSIAVEKTTIQVFPKSFICTFLKDNPIFYKEIFMSMSKELRHSDNLLVLMLEAKSIKKIAFALVYLKKIHSEHCWTIKEIANFISQSLEITTNELVELEKMELIKIENETIEILDVRGLLTSQY